MNINIYYDIPLFELVHESKIFEGVLFIAIKHVWSIINTLQINKNTDTQIYSMLNVY